MIEDLHVHSTMSDGSDTFEQVLEQAAQRGVERLAFTNHDTTAGLTAARELGERLGVQMVGGIEVSAYDFERGRKVHILGLGVEEGAPALAALCGPTLQQRNANSLWQLDRLVEAGYEVDVERALELGRASTCLYKQHLMAALTSEPYPSAGYRTLYPACSRTAASATAISTTWTRATPCGPSWRTAGWRCSRIPASWTATICFPTWWNAVSAASNASIPTTPWRITLAVQSWLSVTASSARAAPTTTEGSAGFPMWGFAFRRRLREPSGALGRMPLRAQARRIGLGGRPAHRPLRPRDRPLRIDAAASCAPRSRPRTGGGSRALAVVRRPSTRYTGRHDARPLIDFAERP